MLGNAGVDRGDELGVAWTEENGGTEGAGGEGFIGGG